MSQSAKSLVDKVENYSQLWTDIENSPKKIQKVSQELTNTVESMNWWRGNVPSWLGGKREEKQKTEKKVKQINEINSIDNAQELVKTISGASDFGNSLKELTSPKPMSLIYWEDEKGKHSYYSDDLALGLKENN